MLNAFLTTAFLTITAVCLPAGKHATATSYPAAPDTWQQEMLDEVNVVRSNGCRCGRRHMRPAKPLRWNNKLAKAALDHARDMEKNNFLGHKGSNGSRIGQRADRAGYNWQSIGENVAWNVQTVKGAVLCWKDSPGHCMSMMSDAYSEMGAARAGDYWVQVFGTRMD